MKCQMLGAFQRMLMLNSTMMAELQNDDSFQRADLPPAAGSVHYLGCVVKNSTNLREENRKLSKF